MSHTNRWRQGDILRVCFRFQSEPLNWVSFHLVGATTFDTNQWHSNDWSYQIIPATSPLDTACNHWPKGFQPTMATVPSLHNTDCMSHLIQAASNFLKISLSELLQISTFQWPNLTLVAPVSSFYTPGATKPVKTSPTGCKLAEWVLGSLATSRFQQAQCYFVMWGSMHCHCGFCVQGAKK